MEYLYTYKHTTKTIRVNRWGRTNLENKSIVAIHSLSNMVNYSINNEKYAPRLSNEKLTIICSDKKYGTSIRGGK